jgi:hypothetical protein
MRHAQSKHECTITGANAMNPIFTVARFSRGF